MRQKEEKGKWMSFVFSTYKGRKRQSLGAKTKQSNILIVQTTWHGDSYEVMFEITLIKNTNKQINKS